MSYVIGLDFGTLSVRALLVETETGQIMATAVSPYPHAIIDHALPNSNAPLPNSNAPLPNNNAPLPNSKAPLPADWALQHPQDWLDGMAETVRSVMQHAADPSQVVGVGIDFTACTPLPVLADGRPLCQQAEWADQPHAWPKLWKHHAAQEQANRITQIAQERGESWLQRYGGIISSEWLLPKALQILEEAPDLYDAADLFMEAGDWVAWQLTGNLARNACAAGFKGLWHKETGYPDEDYLTAVHPHLADFYNSKGQGDVVAPGVMIGTLTVEWAEELGLSVGTAVAAGIIDAHAGAIGAGVTENNVVYMAMGTSTCHMLLAEQEMLCEGISGVVEDGILPGRFGYEAGQAAVGDIFNWFTRHTGQSHDDLTAAAAQLCPGASGLLALDWWNGCRTPLVDADLSGVILGYSLRTSPADVYRALIEATAFGTRLILETLAVGGLPVTSLIVSGGLTKNDLLLQIYADITGLPLAVSQTEQASGLGAAILGAVAGGAHDSLETAIAGMVPPPERLVTPNEQHKTVYDALYEEYKRLVDLFGRDDDSPLKRLRQLKLK